MKYDIYFHGGCFDGAASAAILLYFLRLRGDGYGKFIPLTHPVDKKWWRKLKMKNPSAIVDILYHPKAKIWFDHHPTTFIDKKWEKNFQPDLKHKLNVKSPSCAGLIYRHFTKTLKIKVPKYLRDLASWVDITDRAQFGSVKEALNLNPPAMQIGFYLDSVAKMPVSRQKNLIRLLSEMPLYSAAKTTWIRNGFLKYKKRFDESLRKVKNMLILRGNMVFLNSMGKELVGTRWMPYFFYPKSNYSIRLVKHGKNFVLSVGSNPWNRSKNPAHIGRFLEKRYGGGGHAVVGSAPFRTKKEALREVSNITDYLNKHA